MKRTRLAVIGAGHLGRIHARLACSLPDFDVVAVVDPVAANRTAVAEETQVPAYAAYQEVADQIDAAIVATPTKYHFDVARDLLDRGVHVFIEKPVTPTASDAELLVHAALEQGCVLQVGHVERFNPAFLAAQGATGSPRWISAVRQGPFTFRSTDVSIVLDLMIHDLDLALALIPAEPLGVTASGGKVFGPNEDWAEARVTFSNGSVATFSASRVHPAPQRTMLVMGDTGSVHLDFQAKTALQMERGQELQRGEIQLEKMSPAQMEACRARLQTDLLKPQTLAVRDNNAILEEQREFAAAIRGECAVRCDGVAGMQAVALAERILAVIAAQRFAMPTPHRIAA